MRVRVLDLDGTVAAQPHLGALAARGRAERIDARDLAAKLRIVASGAALEELSNRIGVTAAGPEITFYGSGDFHHLAYALMRRAAEPVSVIHFDNHPDWVRLPGSLNCGSWVNAALKLPRVQRIVTIGPTSDDLTNPEIKTANLPAIRDGRLEVHAWQAPPTRLWGAAVDAPGVATFGRRLVWASLAGRPLDAFADDLLNRLPEGALWITLDKDVLGEGEAVTNWDQGGMRLDDVLAMVRRLGARRRIAGIDVCGDYSPPRFTDPFRAFLSWSDRAARHEDEGEARAVNDAANGKILAALTPLFA